MQHNFFSGSFHDPSDFLILVGVIIAVIVIAADISIITSRTSNTANNPGEKYTESVNNFSGLVCAMLAQQGAGLNQTEICSNLGLPVEVTAEKLNEMEKEG